MKNNTFISKQLNFVIIEIEDKNERREIKRLFINSYFFNARRATLLFSSPAANSNLSPRHETFNIFSTKQYYDNSRLNVLTSCTPAPHENFRTGDPS
jgi:hypothetical protein